MSQGFTKLCRHTQGFFGGNRGAVAVLVAALIIPLVGVTGLAVDTGRGYLLKARLSQALDAAALAGGRVYFQAQRDGDIQMYFDANFPAGFMEAQLGELQISDNVDEGTLTVAIDANLSTTFMRVLGIDEMDVSARATVKRADRGMELALVMDNTGSMYGKTGGQRKIDVMKQSAQDLIDILYGERTEIPNLFVSLVPYTAAINAGAQHSDWVDPAALAGFDYSPNGWKGCVEARDETSDRDVTDDPPADELFQPYYYAYHNIDNDFPPIDESEGTNTTSNAGTGPNLGCGPPITPLTQSRSAIEDNIAAMDSWHRGGTTTNLGLVWGWRTISPRWRGLWGAPTPDEMPFDYDEPLMDKVVIILTDGYNQLYSAAKSYYGHGWFNDSDYTSHGRISEGRLGTTSNFTTARNELNDRMAETCVDMKAEGIVIYTITFAVANNSGGDAIRDIFSNCATNPGYFFDSPSSEDLRETFRAIASQLSNLRIYE
ncbi:MAG: pilus assembly protein TadG-related protein [Rhodovibrionaceae bacterium]